MNSHGDRSTKPLPPVPTSLPANIAANCAGLASPALHRVKSGINCRRRSPSCRAQGASCVAPKMWGTCSSLTEAGRDSLGPAGICSRLGSRTMCKRLHAGSSDSYRRNDIDRRLNIGVVSSGRHEQPPTRRRTPWGRGLSCPDRSPLHHESRVPHGDDERNDTHATQRLGACLRRD